MSQTISEATRHQKTTATEHCMALIKKEDKFQPLSNLALQRHLQDVGIYISNDEVAKLLHAAGIPKVAGRRAR